MNRQHGTDNSFCVKFFGCAKEFLIHVRMYTVECNEPPTFYSQNGN